ncbi:MAG: lytic transglycosylase domain-containing protein, partial [Flavobacteriales bacterium]
AFLKEAKNQFGSWAMAAASYNMGRNGLAKASANQQETEYWYLSLNEETSRYLFRILAVKEIFQVPEAYGYVVRQDDVYNPWQFRIYEVKDPIVNLADFAKKMNCRYRDLKYLNPWLRSNELPNKSGKVYNIKLPEG